MKIEYFFFIAYILLLTWKLPKISFIKHAGLPALQIRLLFLFKILAGIACAFYFEKIAARSDYLAYNDDGKIQYDLLLSNPVLFFTDFTLDLKTYGLGGLFESSNSFWAFLRTNLLFKCIGILNLITAGNFYLNTIVFCSLVFFGHMAFYRIYSEIYKGHKTLVLLASFCLPSILFYTSCIHKDGIIFLSLGLISYTFFKFLNHQSRSRLIYTFFFLTGLASVFLFRNYLFVALVPAMVTAWLCTLAPNKKVTIFLASYLCFFTVFFLSALGNTMFNLPAAVVKRKADFALLTVANTNIPMNELYPNLGSFFVNLPQAINHFFFRPYLWEFSMPVVLLTALELFFYQLILACCLIFRKKPLSITNSFNVFGFALFINAVLIIGYTIPNIGAIVRYRSIFWIFLICPLLCNTDWKRLFNFHKRPGNTLAS